MHKNISFTFFEKFFFEKQGYLKIHHKNLLVFLAERGLGWSHLTSWLFGELAKAILTPFLWDMPVRNTQLTARENDCAALCEIGWLDKWR